MHPFSPGSDCAAQIERRRRLVTHGHTRPLTWRLEQLRRPEKALQSEEELLESLAEDLRKPAVEAYYEISSVRQELRLFQRKLHHWLRPERVGLRPHPWPLERSPHAAVIPPPWRRPWARAISPHRQGRTDQEAMP